MLQIRDDLEKEAIKERARVAFKVYDQNKDGYVSKQEMKTVSRNLTKEQINNVFKANDTNKDGYLEPKELGHMMRKGRIK